MTLLVLPHILVCWSTLNSWVCSFFHVAANGFSSDNWELSSIFNQRLNLQIADGYKTSSCSRDLTSFLGLYFWGPLGKVSGWLHLNLGWSPSTYQRKLRWGPKGPRTGPQKTLDDSCLTWTACLAILSLDLQIMTKTKKMCYFLTFDDNRNLPASTAALNQKNGQMSFSEMIKLGGARSSPY